jgi:hypothetical protein
MMGYSYGTEFDNCNVSGTIKSIGNDIGSIIGNGLYNQVRECTSDATISGLNNIGGIAGEFYKGIVQRSYFRGALSGNTKIGGILGYNNEGSIRYCYAGCTMSGNNSLGGLAGSERYSSVRNSFWDTETSVVTTTAGSGTGKTTAEMKTQSTFTNAYWNFDALWAIDGTTNGGYPYFNDRRYPRTQYTVATDTDADGKINLNCFAHLQWLSMNPDQWANDFELDGDIDADSSKILTGYYGFAPIGNDTTSFRGTFDANYHSISNLYCFDPDSSQIGMFGVVSGSAARVENLNLLDCFIYGGEMTGGLAGYLYRGTFEDCYLTGDVMATDSYSGGVAGKNYYGQIKRCCFTGDISGSSYTGGVAGLSDNATIERSYMVGTLSGSSQVGGIAGRAYSGMIRLCYAAPTITGSSYTGGITGSIQYTDVRNCLWDTEQTGETSTAGNEGTGKTTAEMKTKSTYTDQYFNFDGFWGIESFLNNGYPFFDENFLARNQYVAPTDTSGNGKYNLYCFSHLQWLSQNPGMWGKDFELDCDIDADSTKLLERLHGFDPIGNDTTSFTGTFDGKGHTIKNLWIFDRDSSNLGFFGKVRGDTAFIYNLKIDSSLVYGYEYVGGLIGNISNADIANCSVTDGDVLSLNDNTGGICGYSGYNQITRCYSNTNVSGRSNVAGMVGESNHTTMQNCYSKGSVSGSSSKVAGIAGYDDNSTLNNVYSSAIVSGSGYTGGLIGGERYSTVNNSFWDTETSGQSSTAGNKGTGKSAAEMKTESTFTDADWDFNLVWDIDASVNDGYPTLIPGIIESQKISLAERWNMISSYLIPMDNSFTNNMTSISSNIFLAKNGRGKIHLPDYGITQIDSLKYDEGYLFYMKAADTLEIFGYYMDGDVEINLSQGWNMISYLKKEEQSLTDAVATLGTDVFLIKDGSGKIYLPDYGINQIGTLKPGEGYLIYMKASGTLIYPEP